ncbi:cytochrome P450 [Conidiobolus coronatus NRRL 28638]|uniref:Cytochrome P450 n=1 Tax=Conidiobolus coronatus (strain ATCC 28846 / CBS 209.66 / NRRL 28638) TaxID=796925 RepID=A0A137PIW2_CONC2|nr:cytochrome P450 [Conidiobolus coronatus NRRL 28638]|eukprot:KXN74932.1 cytochrome P450 [Conidiobolus coronatus NRRL 28638]
MLYAILFIVILASIYFSVNKVPTEFKGIPKVSLWSFIRSIQKEDTLQEHYHGIIEPAIKERGYALVFLKSSWSLAVTRSDIIKQVFRNSQQFTKDVIRHHKSLEYKFTGKQNIVRSNGDDWRRFRRPANPIFNQTFQSDIFAESVKEVLNALTDRVNEHGSNPFEVSDLMELMTLDILGKGIFDFDFEAVRLKGTSKYHHIYNSAFSGVFDPLYLLLPFIEKLKLKKRMKKHHDAIEFKKFILGIVEERRSDIKAGKANGKDLLATMLAADPESPFEPLTDEELVENLIVFFIAGHDTTANTLSYAMYYLARNPEIQEKLRNEIYTTLKIPKDHEKLVVASTEQFKEMEYLNCVIKEVMRISPAVVQMFRIVEEDFNIQNENIVVPKGTLITLSVYGAHHDPKTYPNPHKFEPERFLNGKYDTDIYLPFGGGSRMCVGMGFSLMEQRVYLTLLLQKFTIEIKEDNHDFNSLRLSGLVLTKAKDLKLNFHPRF